MVLLILWGLVVALIAGLVALALNRWVPGWSVAKRVLIAVAASMSPSFAIVGFYMAELGLISFWFSPDEFLISFALHIVLIAAVSTPIAWLVSRQAARTSVPTDVFD